MPLEVGQIVEGKVTGITHFGAFIELPGGETGLVHISEIADTFVKDIKNHIKDNEKVKVKVISIDKEGRISLSIRRVKPKKSSQPIEIDWINGRRDSGLSFEDKLLKFLKESEEKQQDLRRNSESKKKAAGFRRNRDY
ncbi:MAG: binding domain protein [Thermosediminibacterales bacterium]|nr:binding domain protein [Thermosediminibacterales bacterium]MDK2836832.1 binding domain protein [Thermosediminibacterales bacterium]